MATIKSYTDVEQSRKLAKILPPETADGGWYGTDNPFAANTEYWLHTKYMEKAALPAWNLAALLAILPPVEGFRPIIDLDINLIRYEGNYRDELCFSGSNLIDACVAMIEKLHELKML